MQQSKRSEGPSLMNYQGGTGRTRREETRATQIVARVGVDSFSTYPLWLGIPAWRCLPRGLGRTSPNKQGGCDRGDVCDAPNDSKDGQPFDFTQSGGGTASSRTYAIPSSPYRVAMRRRGRHRGGAGHRGRDIWPRRLVGPPRPAGQRLCHARGDAAGRWTRFQCDAGRLSRRRV